MKENPATTACVTGLIRAEGRILTELTRNFRRYGISHAGFNVLMILDGDDEPLSPHQIGDRRLVTRGTVTGVLDSLERAGLVRRRPHPDDGRMLLVDITDAGRALLRRMLPGHRSIEEDLTGQLSERDKATLARLLGKLG